MKLAIRTIVSTITFAGIFLLSGCGGDVTPFAKPPALTDKAQGLYEVQTVGGEEVMLSVGANLKGKAVVYSVKSNYAYTGPVTIAQDGTFKGTLTDFYGGSTVLNVAGKVIPPTVQTGLGTFTFAASGSHSIKVVKGNQRSQGLENPFKGTYKGTVDVSDSGDPLTDTPPSEWTDTLTVTVDGQGNVIGKFANANDQLFFGFANHIDEFGNDNGFGYWDYYFDAKGARHFLCYFSQSFDSTTTVTGTLDDTSVPAYRKASQSDSKDRLALLKKFRSMHPSNRSPR